MRDIPSDELVLPHDDLTIEQLAPIDIHRLGRLAIGEVGDFRDHIIHIGHLGG